MEAFDPEATRRFFKVVTDRFAPATRPACFVTTHILRDRPFFLGALSAVAEIISLTPKPKSIHNSTLSWLSQRYPVDPLDRETLGDPKTIAAMIQARAAGKRVVFIDVGGYYSDSIGPLASAYPSTVLGVVEDTENGYKRYAKRATTIPIISVARSPLKNPEDFLAGQSIVFSTEAIIRQAGDIMQGRRAAVLGYGKLGRSIAGTLHERHVETVVVEPDPIRAVEARSHGFHVAQQAENALQTAGLVFCATGSISLHLAEFESLPKGCYVATATSSDDELDTKNLKSHFRRRRVTDLISRYDARHRRDRHFYLLNHGQAVNFVHGATVGPFIYLVHAEIIAAVGLLAGASPAEFSPTNVVGLGELGEDIRAWIAQAWLEEFHEA